MDSSSNLADGDLWCSLFCNCATDSNGTSYSTFALGANFSSQTEEPSSSPWQASFWDQEWLYGNDTVRQTFFVVGFLGMGLAAMSLLQMALRCLPQSLAQWQELAKQLQESPGEPSPVLKSKVLEVKVRQLRTLLQAACYLLTPLTAMATLNDYGTLGGGHLICSAQLVLAVFALWPGLVTARSLDAVFLLLSGLVALGLSPFGMGELHILPALLLGNFLAAMLVAVRRTGFTRLPVLAAASLMHGTSTCLLILVRGGLLMNFRMPMLGLQVALTLLVPLFAPLLEHWAQAWMRQVLELEELQGLLAASQSLLRSCFDVVVELDAQGAIVSKGPQLGALLLRERHCTEGEQFTALIEGELDRQDFRQRLARPVAKDLGLAESMQVTMKDACGHCLRLELMWFSFTRPESRERHAMVGLREFSDAAAETRLPPECVTVSAELACDRSGQSEHIVNVAVSEGSASLPEDQSVTSGPALESGASLIVDKEAPGQPVRRISASFRARVGHIPEGQPLANFLKKPKRLERWLAQHGQGGRPGDLRVAFNMPQGKVRATCMLLKEESRGTTLLFYGIHLEADGESRAPLANRGTSPRSSSASLHRATKARL